MRRGLRTMPQTAQGYYSDILKLHFKVNHIKISLKQKQTIFQSDVKM